MNKIVIIVEDGKVTDVFATEECDVEVIDLDINDDYDAKEKLEDEVDMIRKLSGYKWVY